jgi:uncharacterized protein YecT (DUF1311 family)
MKCCVIAATLMTLILAGPAHGEDAANPKDVGAIRACLNKQPASTIAHERCIETLYKRCIGPDENAASSGAQVACLRREQLVWDQILNDSFRAMRDRLDEDQQVKLRDMQRAWIDMREKTCGFFYDFYQGTMANPMIATCENRETGRRAIFLLGFADEVASWPQNSR